MTQSSAGRFSFLFFILALSAVYVFATSSRVKQLYEGWWGKPALYYLDDIPMVTTLDAYKWVRIAQEWKDGIYDTAQKDPLAFYPDGMERLRPVPMLSVMLAKLSFFFNGNLYEAGIRLIPFLAGLFVFPFGLYFYRLGLPLAGVIGGFCGAFSTTYYLRTTAGRIDTDSLNMFFPFLTAFFILLAAEKKEKRQILFYSALAGFSQFLFYWWYHHSAFLLIFAVVLAAALFFYKHKPSVIGLAAGVYAIFANPFYIKDSLLNLYGLVKAYLFMAEADISGFPNVYKTITEAARQPVEEVIRALFVHPVFVIFAFAVFILMALRLNKKLIPLIPVFLMGMMVFVSANRFSMFLLPFIGAAFGYILNVTVDLLPDKIIRRGWLRVLAGYAAGGLFLLALMLPGRVNGLIFYYLPPPSIEPIMFNTFNMLREKLPENSAVYTWWDFGLAISAQSGHATFHDGMSQNTPKTWLIARSLLSSQETLARNIAFLANTGMEKLESANASDTLILVDHYDEPPESDRIYLSFTQDMIHKFGSIQYIGGWDLEKSRPTASSGISTLVCEPSGGPVLTCSGNKFDTALGLINTRTPVKKFAHVDITAGRLIRERDTGFAADIHVIVLEDKGTGYMVWVMGEKEYKSAFVQLYLLGNYDPERFREVINVYPLTRVFHVLKK